MRPEPADPPNLADPAARAAYRGELRRLAPGWRLLGFVLVAGGAGVLLASDPDAPARRYAWIALAAGWTVLIGVIVYRTRYHRMRMDRD
jgi:hypothetical protein